MTNRDLLQTPEQQLSELDRQRLYLLKVNGTPMPCPACAKPVNLFGAAGIDLDDYDFGQTLHQYHCPACGARLELVVPFALDDPLWHWQLEDNWLKDQLRKARKSDSQDPANGGDHPV